MKLRYWLIIGLHILLLLLLPQLIESQERVSHEPKLCSGKTEQGWGVAQNLDCPAAHAFYSQCCRPGRIATFASGTKIPVSGSCCPLPATDILIESDKVIVADDRCPDNYVVTGGREKSCPECGFELVCTKINTTRYVLGSAEFGINWGFSSSDWKISSLVDRDELPWAIRYGVGRVSRWSFANSGCVGRVPGSLFTGRDSKRCDGYIFRQLKFTGLTGDPAAGTPVTMFPDCDLVSDPFQETLSCIQF